MQYAKVMMKYHVPNCMHTACTSTYFIRAASVLAESLKELDLECRVNFPGPLSFKPIRQHPFKLLLFMFVYVTELQLKS